MDYIRSILTVEKVFANGEANFQFRVSLHSYQHIDFEILADVRFKHFPVGYEHSMLSFFARFE